jgi:opacity protein-like surface antigen
VQFGDAVRGVDAAGVDGGWLWQFVAGRMFSEKWGAELLWTEQFSGYHIESGGNSGNLFTMSLLQLHGNLVYQFGAAGSRLRPFVFGGAGATFLSARDLQSEQKFSIGFGGGVKYFLWRDVAFRGQVRYKPTFLNDEGSDFCDPFGFCQSTLRQFEFAGGVTFRF